MHRLTLNTLVGMLALTTSGSEPNTTKLNNSSAFPSAAIVKISKKSNNAPAKPKTALAQNPTNLQNTAGLIKSTDPKHRAKEVLQGRTDPFSGISAPLPVEPEPTPQKVFPKLPQLPVAKELPVAPPEEPPKPKASLAKAISVEGVMGIGNERHAIVKLPDDASSRYVAEGQELLGGRVIVKAIKIDATNSEDPTVIFEQNGVEVAASVGFKPDTKNNTGLTESDSTVASTSSPMSILTADVAAKQVSSKPVDEVAYRPPSSPVSSTSADSQRVKPYQQPPFNSSSVSVALNELPLAKKLSPPTGFGKNKLDAKSVDLKPRLSSTERYKQLVYRLRYSREGPANNTTPGVDKANTRFAQHPFEKLVSDGRELGNNSEDARETNSTKLDPEQKAKAYRQLVDRLRYGASEVNRQY